MFFYQEENTLVPYNYNAFDYVNCGIPAHMHGDFEFIYVNEGILEVKVEDRTEVLLSGEAALIFPNQVHGFYTSRYSKVRICVFSKDYVPEFSRFIKDRVCLSNQLRLEKINRQVILRTLMNDAPGRLELCAALMLICAAFIKEHGEKEFVQTEYSGREKLIHQMLTYIGAHYKENITLRDMAAQLGYEEHYISRRFSAFFKMNFKQFINEYRIQYARQLLAEENERRTMVEIAYMSGFGSVRNFNRAYRRVMGGQPREQKR